RRPTERQQWRPAEWDPLATAALQAVAEAASAPVAAVGPRCQAARLLWSGREREFAGLVVPTGRARAEAQVWPVPSAADLARTTAGSAAPRRAGRNSIKQRPPRRTLE